MSFEYIERNVSEVKKRIEAARGRAGREQDVMLLPAVKYAEPEEIEFLYKKCGIRQVGENRVQQMLSHMEALDCEGLEFHFIGTLQTNKVKYIIDKVRMIHSLDSIKLAQEIDKQARKHGIVMDVLVEVNCGEEESKSGINPENAVEFITEISKLNNIRVKGLMTMAPFEAENVELHQIFSDLHKISVDISSKKLDNVSMEHLSMGMSGDYEVAVQEGSTIVRIGTAVFK